MEDLKIEKVSFAYDENKITLKDINIMFPKGSKTALLGRNGFFAVV